MTAPAPMPRPEFILLTGPLGSGKTTLLTDFLQSGDMSETGVIVNDAGEVNVDGAVLSADTRDLAMATLSDGCICCSMGNSLQEGIDAVLEARAVRGLGPPRRIILETSGLAEPAPIVRSLRAVRQMAFDLRIISTFDAGQPRVGDDFLPHYACQLAAAQVVVLTKLDVMPEADWNPRAEEARAFNPLAAQILEADPRARALAAFSRAYAEPEPRAAHFSALPVGSARITVANARWQPNATWADISEWIDNLTGFLGARLLRLKGLVQPMGHADPVLINGIGDAFSPPRSVRMADDRKLGLTLILRDVAQDELARWTGHLSQPKLDFQ
ncbi:GTP-binding protein [Azorhizobium oxalatiphilum]|uniref:GTP-binding protein n=1 Tax=Azorhizobium oxalatiphilum TaxID=980631 RepID=A0A917BN30_9HYPH|nr:GTP-binding protein [Azorhizobium oxalatiphilum]GGF50294.1 GTP-binding protein [Azorhizobium oxalatiphilum]